MTIATLYHQVGSSVRSSLGEVVAEETYINFVVSQGTEPKLNDISGYTKSEAQSYLASVGAEYIGHETSEYSNTVDKDKVIRTVPGQERQLPKEWL